MKLKKIIVPILMLLAVAIIIDRIMARNPSWSAALPDQRVDQNSGEGDQSKEDLSPITYFCKEGMMEVDFGPGAATMAILLPDGRTLELPQARSGSGIRYEKDGMEFIGKGEQAFVMEKGKTIYSDCTVGTKKDNYQNQQKNQR